MKVRFSALSIMSLTLLFATFQAFADADGQKAQEFNYCLPVDVKGTVRVEASNEGRKNIYVNTRGFFPVDVDMLSKFQRHGKRGEKEINLVVFASCGASEIAFSFDLDFALKDLSPSDKYKIFLIRENRTNGDLLDPERIFIGEY